LALLFGHGVTPARQHSATPLGHACCRNTREKYCREKNSSCVHPPSRFVRANHRRSNHWTAPDDRTLGRDVTNRVWRSP
jgi:hypothetical protein